MAITRDAHLALRRHIVGALKFLDAVQCEGVAAHRGAVANEHLDIALDLVGFDHRHADTKHRDTQMRHHHARQRARNLAQTGGRIRPIHPLGMDASPQVGSYRAHYPIGHDQPQCGDQAHFTGQRAGDKGTGNGHGRSPAQAHSQGR